LKGGEMMNRDTQRLLESLPDHKEEIEFHFEWERNKDKVKNMTPRGIAYYFWRRSRLARGDD